MRTTLALAALFLAACGPVVLVEEEPPPRELSQAATLCAAKWHADIAAPCAADADCGSGEWCMVSCAFFHREEPVGLCAPLKPTGAPCSHIGGGRECASGACQVVEGVGDACF